MQDTSSTVVDFRNVYIERNRVQGVQSILITSNNTNAKPRLTNCTISGNYNDANDCVIGYRSASSTVSLGAEEANLGLDISNNNCYAIITADETGRLITSSTEDTGIVTISNNAAAFIQINSYGSQSYCTVNNNRLWSRPTSDNIGISFNRAIYVTSSRALITENRINSTESDGGPASYYDYGIHANGIVSNNYITNSFSLVGIFSPGAVEVHNNTIFRDQDITYYIQLFNNSADCMCVDNKIGSRYVDDSETDDYTIFYSTNGNHIVERNINHVKSRQLSLRNVLKLSDLEYGANSAYLNSISTSGSGFVSSTGFATGGAVNNINGYIRLQDVLPSGTKMLRASFDWYTLNGNWSGGEVRLWVGDGQYHNIDNTPIIIIAQNLTDISGVMDTNDTDPNLFVDLDHYINVAYAGVTATSEAKSVFIQNLIIKYTW